MPGRSDERPPRFSAKCLCPLWVISPRTRQVSATSGVGGETDISDGMSEAGTIPDVRQAWPVRGKVAITRHWAHHTGNTKHRAQTC